MPQQNQQLDKKQISRRDVIKAAGVLSLGLLYTQPFVEKIHAQPAFQGYGGGGDSGGGGDTGGGGNVSCGGGEYLGEDGLCHPAS